ncbi:hypothetical protein RND71_003229 [Anisodus tanguticus]|uniref:Uncharacterized protein n=1 Tax=Anisodus tanguticus TaxID=243964 RepID=A0AAE1SSX2_9SOLA|nr:hypothetical protein RND71_003229 [Anisodus tanguticus]
MMRPSSYSTHNSHMMMGHGGQHHGGYHGSHGHGYGRHGHHGHMPHDLTNFSSSTTMVHNDGGYGTGMQPSSLAHMSSSSMAMGHHGHGHGHGYGGSHPSSYSQSQKFNWALKNLDD